MKTLSRRGFITGSASLGLGTAAGLVKAPSARGYQTEFVRDFEPQELCFMDQYYEGILGITKGIRDTQIENISRAMQKAYELKSKGGSIYSHVVYGHYSMFAGSRDRPGQPWVLPQCGITPTKEEFDAMKAGDFLITDRIDPGTIEVRKRGVYVVGVTNNYYRFYKTPPDGLRPDWVKESIEEVSDLVIDSQVPWDNGLVSAPQIPHFKLCPSSGITQFLVYWACTAVLANLIGTKGKGSDTEPAEQYLDMAYDRFLMIGTDRPKIDWVAGQWADRVLERKARLLVYGHPQDVESYDGARNMFVNDAYVCASSSMIADQYEKRADDLRDSDIVLIGAFTSDNALEISVARRARDIGAYTVAFCPFSTDGDTSGVRLFKEVDVAFNSYSDEREGVIAVKGFP
ncbi:hypothetical protein LLG96_02605, partial [bacterium]|nr:hypothetical protein [bacterium]